MNEIQKEAMIRSCNQIRHEEAVLLEYTPVEEVIDVEYDGNLDDKNHREIIWVKICTSQNRIDYSKGICVSFFRYRKNLEVIISERRDSMMSELGIH
jgi:hypothetical protein